MEEEEDTAAAAARVLDSGSCSATDPSLLPLDVAAVAVGDVTIARPLLEPRLAAAVLSASEVKFCSFVAEDDEDDEDDAVCAPMIDTSLAATRSSCMATLWHVGHEGPAAVADDDEEDEEEEEFSPRPDMDGE